MSLVDNRLTFLSRQVKYRIVICALAQHFQSFKLASQVRYKNKFLTMIQKEGICTEQKQIPVT